jgi:hypothetical protein
MLKSLDVLIGFAFIMLLASMAVTALTQAITSACQWRGKHLYDGLVSLLGQIDPKLTRFSAEQIAAAVLTHPLIAQSGGKPGAVIQREEFIRILLELAAGREPGGKSMDGFVRATLKKVLESRGIAEPGVVLEDIQLLALKLEGLRPDLSAAARQGLAILSEASSEFVARTNAWFDETMDRVAHEFSRHTRLVTLAVAAMLALTLQLDALDLLRRLALDDATRTALVTRAQTGAEPIASVAELRQFARSGYAVLPENWAAEWNRGKLPGIVLSMLLLSLGAPFWYNALKDLVRLRAPLERKEQEQREQRQAGPAPLTAWLPGERGDLSATGAAG